MTESYTFGLETITCHAWNKDRTEVAVCPKSDEVHVYKQSGSQWKQAAVLHAHDMTVMCLDWAPKTNRIVTCAADKTAYVWSLDNDGKWIPAWVILRTNRAAVCVKWSPQENKFAVGAGDKLVSVSFFVPENNWWLSKHIKRPLRSTVTAIDWHPDNKVLVAGSTDWKVRVFGAYVKDVEDAPGPGPWGATSTLGTLLAEFPNSPNGGGWIHAVAFSPCGNKICWVAHNSSICVADATKGNAVVRLYTKHLPFMSCVWISSNSIVAAGHSCVPILYSLKNGQLHFVSKLDNSQKRETAGISAMRKFQSLDRQARTEINDSVLDSIHQNTITCIRKMSPNEFSTSGLDGQLVLWDTKVKTRRESQPKRLIHVRTNNHTNFPFFPLSLKTLENSIAGLNIV